LSLRGAIRDARTYELMTIFSPDVAEDEIQETIDRVVGYITGATGENVDVNRESPWGRRRLAYAIRHASRDVRDGFYTLYHFQIQPHRVIDVEREIKLNDRIMRYLLTQYTPKPIDETAIAQASDETATSEEGDELANVSEQASDEPVDVSEQVADVEPEIDDVVIEEHPAAPEPEPDVEVPEAETPEEPTSEEA
jgi:small subunit ribosomal protein S6